MAVNINSNTTRQERDVRQRRFGFSVEMGPKSPSSCLTGETGTAANDTVGSTLLDKHLSRREQRVRREGAGRQPHPGFFEV